MRRLACIAAAMAALATLAAPALAAEGGSRRAAA